MEIEQARWTSDGGWMPAPPGRLAGRAGLVLIFGDRDLLETGRVLQEARRLYPEAVLCGCSTAGEILGVEVRDGTAALTAVAFTHAKVAGSRTDIAGVADSFAAGARLARALNPRDLTHVLLLAEAPPAVNGSELVRGMMENLPAGVAVTGGIAGDGARFGRACVVWDGAAGGGGAAVGFYGSHLKVGFSSRGGWDPFGPERLITRSRGNVLYELDGKSALELYKKYLGDHAGELPGAAVHYPLALRTAHGETGVVRTVLAVDEGEQSMTFAGDVPEGSYARLMMANFDRLIDGASAAAGVCREAMGAAPAELALLISCVGRKIVLGQRIEEEVEAVREVLGPGPAFGGFYSYGEIAPFAGGARCELHNETMTITTLSERD